MLVIPFQSFGTYFLTSAISINNKDKDLTITIMENSEICHHCIVKEVEMSETWTPYQ